MTNMIGKLFGFTYLPKNVHLLSSKWTKVGLIGAIALIALIGIITRQRSPGGLLADGLTPPLSPLPQDPDIQVYFNQSQAAQYTEPYRQQQRLGDDLEQVLLDAIASANTRIDMAVQEFRLPRIAQALVEKQQAGVQVRVILENTYRRPWSSFSAAEIRELDSREQGKYEEFLSLADLDGDGQVSEAEAAERDALAILAIAQVPVIDDTADGSRGSDLMHHKMLIVDGQRIVMGSANFTTSDVHGDAFNPDSRGNANHLLVINSAAIAQWFTDEFNLMWGDGPGGQEDSLFGLQKPYRPPQTFTVGASTVTVQVSPTSSSLDWDQSVNGLIGRSLAPAQSSIDLALFVFSDQELSNILESRHQQGVEVRALIDPGFMYRSYSEGLDMLGITLPDNRCVIEANNHPWPNAIATVGIPALPDGDILHHKVGIVDGTTVITGSQNWSNAANNGNDENLLVIENPAIAAHFQREFERLYADAVLGIPDWLQAEVRETAARCR